MITLVRCRAVPLLALAAVAAAGLGQFLHDDASAAPVPKGKGVLPSGVLVLDNCDEHYKGKPTYEDNLSSFDASGKLTFRVSGLNNCEAVGSNHMVAIDAKRGWTWALENVGRRVRKFDLKGKELLRINDVDANALAVDADTGHLWVLTSTGTIHGEKTVVYDAKGTKLATHDFSGWDIAHDPKGKALWIASRTLTKVDATTGKVTFSKPITVWCSSCVAACPETGKVWVTTRLHPQVPGSKNQLLTFDNDGTLKHTIDLGDVSPFHVSVAPKGGPVWVTLFRKAVRRYSAAGKLEAEHKLEALTAAADRSTRDVWLVTPTEVQRLSPEGKVLRRAAHARKTSQAWIAAY